MIVIFVKLKKSVMPIINEDGDMALFEDEQEAMDFANDHILCSANKTFFVDLETETVDTNS